MSTKTRLSLVLIVCLLVASPGGAMLPRTSLTSQEPAYIEPLLFSLETERLSVIVTAADSKAAARAVEHIGGQITIDL